MTLVTLTGVACSVGLAETVDTLRAGTLVAVLLVTGVVGSVETAGTLRVGTVVVRLLNAGGTMWLMLPWRMVMSCCRAVLWLSLSGVNGELVDGFQCSGDIITSCQEQVNG